MQEEIRWLLEEKYAGKHTLEAERDIERLKKGEHIDYVIGWVHFLGCKIDLSQRPLIPRPETEYWTEKAIQQIARAEGSIHVLDMFAGSGCVGVAILKHVKNATVDFADKEEKIVKQIEINLQLNKIEKKRYQVTKSDIFSGIKGKYTFILANPPYVAETRKNQVQQSVVDQEPKNAVFAGEDGLEVIRPFIKEAANYIQKDGMVWMEFDDMQKDEIEQILENSLFQNWNFYKDQYGKWRYVVFQTL